MKTWLRWRSLRIGGDRANRRHLLGTTLLAGVALSALGAGMSAVSAAETSAFRFPFGLEEQAGANASSMAPLSRTASRWSLSGFNTSLPNAAPSFVLPSSFETSEYQRSWFLGKINAADAYALGFTGKGVLVAVVDSGLDIAHPEFAGRVSPLLRSFADGEAPSSMSDVGRNGNIAGHGTHVAGIIGAARNDVGTQGVAYNATILPLRAVDVAVPADGVDPTVNALYYAARSGAKVLNGSYGPDALPPRWLENPSAPGTYVLNPHHKVMPNTLVIAGGLDDEYNAVKAAAAADIVLVFAAGNEYLDQPVAAANPSGIAFFPYIRPQNHGNGVYRFIEDLTDPNNPDTYKIMNPADPRLADVDLSDLQGALIAVVSTDRNNKIASYSNRCGVTFLWCLAAPGGDHARPNEDKEAVEILSTYPYSTYKTMVGTSMAAPVVAGGAAVLREAFPYMTARQIIEVILTTTDNIGPREIYGRGLFNLGRAIRGPREFGAEGFAQTFDVDTRGYNSTWSNDIIGTGGLVKRGQGNLVLTGANTYAGGTSALGGVLTLNGSVASEMRIGSSATLRGTGRVNAPLLLAGTLEPGGANGTGFGTFTVAGNAVLSGSSTYRVDANTEGQHDRLVVGGTTTLAGGALDVVLVNGLPPVHTALEIVDSAGGTTGVFGTLRTNSVSAFLNPSIRYTGNGVRLSFERNRVPFANAETRADDKDVARALEALGAGSVLDDAVMRLDAAAADQAFDALAGEAHASAITTAFGDARLVQNTLLKRLQAPMSTTSSMTVQAAYAADRPGMPQQPVTMPYPSLDPRRFALWGEGFGSWSKVRSNGNAYGLDVSTGGFILGAEATLDPSVRIGVSGGFTRTSFDVDILRSSGANESVFGAMYGSAQWGALAVRLGASYAGHDVSMRRTIIFPGFADQTSASYNGSTMMAFGEVGYRLEVARVQLEPFAGASVLRLDTDNFAETGGAAALIGTSRSYGLGTTTLGLRAEARVSEQSPLTLKGMLGWRHAFGDVEPQAVLAFSGGASVFTVSGAPSNRDALVAEAGLDWQASEAITLGVGYAGEIGSQAQDHTLKGSFTWRF